MSSVFPDGPDNLGLTLVDGDDSGEDTGNTVGLHPSLHREERAAINAMQAFLLLEHGTNFNNSGLGIGVPVSTAVAAINGQYFLPVKVLGRTVLSGIRYKKGTGVTAVNVRSALYDRMGQRVANKTTSLAVSTTASVGVDVPFDGAVIVNPGLYWASLIWSAAAANHFLAWAINTATVWNYMGPYWYAAQAAFVTAESLSPPPDSAIQILAAVPWVTTY